jgi:hypothetical protein
MSDGSGDDKDNFQYRECKEVHRECKCRLLRCLRHALEVMNVKFNEFRQAEHSVSAIHSCIVNDFYEIVQDVAARCVGRTSFMLVHQSTDSLSHGVMLTTLP